MIFFYDSACISDTQSHYYLSCKLLEQEHSEEGNLWRLMYEPRLCSATFSRKQWSRIQAYLGDSSSHFRTAGAASGYHEWPEFLLSFQASSAYGFPLHVFHIRLSLIFVMRHYFHLCVRRGAWGRELEGRRGSVLEDLLFYHLTSV